MTTEEISGCEECRRWIQDVPIPAKVIILKCTRCKTDYTLYPNGQIAYEMPAGAITLSLGEKPPRSSASTLRKGNKP